MPTPTEIQAPPLPAAAVEESLADLHRELERLLESGHPDDRQTDRICLALAALAYANGTWRQTAELMLQEIGPQRSQQLLGQLASALSRSPEFVETASAGDVMTTAYVAGILSAGSHANGDAAAGS